MIKNTLNPIWNQTFTFFVNDRYDTIVFSCFDDVTIVKDDLGSCEIELNQFSHEEPIQMTMKLKSKRGSIQGEIEFVITLRLSKKELIQMKTEQLMKVEKDFNNTKLKFQEVAKDLKKLWIKNIEEIDITNYKVIHKKLLECEEEMNKKIELLDTISSGQFPNIKTTRKQIGDSIQWVLDVLEPLKVASSQKMKELDLLNRTGPKRQRNWS